MGLLLGFRREQVVVKGIEQPRYQNPPERHGGGDLVRKSWLDFDFDAAVRQGKRDKPAKPDKPWRQDSNIGFVAGAAKRVFLTSAGRELQCEVVMGKSAGTKRQIPRMTGLASLGFGFS
jgi:hypothetical protein